MKSYRDKNRDDILQQGKTHRYENQEKTTEYYHPKGYLLASINFKCIYLGIITWVSMD